MGNFFLNVYFIFEKETKCEWGKDRERRRDRIRSRFLAPRCHHRAWRGARTHEPGDRDLSSSRTLNWLSHPGALGNLLLILLSKLSGLMFLKLKIWIKRILSAWLAQLLEHAILDLGVMSLNPALGIEITWINKQKERKKENSAINLMLKVEHLFHCAVILNLSTMNFI